MAFLQSLGQLRSPVSTYANLPLTGNVKGDLRISTDTGDAYTWTNISSSGVLTDWNKVTTAAYADLIGAPYSTALDIDNAVKVITGLSINIALLAFNTLTGMGAAVARMFDGMVNQFTVEDEGLETADCENYVYADAYNNVSGGYYLPDKGDLDVYTRMLIHGDGVQDSTTFVDLLRTPLTSSNAKVDLTVKKFGTGSIKFNGTNSSLAISDASGIIMGKYTKAEFYAEPMCIDFWFRSASAGLQPILANIYFDDGYGKVYDPGDVICIKRQADGKLYASILVATEYGMTETLIEVISATSISDNTWYHIAVQKLATGYLQIWINGSLDATSVEHKSPDNPNYFQPLLKFGQLDTSYLNGYLDEIRLSNTQRYTTTFTPMTKAYNESVTPAPTPTIEDSSSLANAITVYGNARMSGNNLSFGNSSLYLDGIDSYISVANNSDFSFLTNLLTNNDFETWSGGGSADPDGWTIRGAGQYVRESTIKKSGSYSVKLWANDKSIEQTIHSGLGINYWKNKIVTFGAWVYVPSGGVIANSCIYINDGVTSTRTYIPEVRDVWQWITVTKTISSSATQVACNLQMVDTTSLTMYFDKAVAVEGSSIPSNMYNDSYNGDFTIEAWIDPISYGSSTDMIIMEKTNSFSLHLNKSTKYIHFNTIGYTEIIAPTVISLDTWYHVAVVRNNNTVKLYINGTMSASASIPTISNSSNSINIGSDSSSYFFDGYIEEVRFSNGIARWTSNFTVPSAQYTSDSYTKLLIHANTQTVPNMVLQSVGYVANYVPTSARVVVFEEDIDTIEPNVDLKIEISRDGGTTFTTCLIAKDQEFGDGTLNLFTGSVDLSTQPNGELLVWKLTTQNNKDCRVRGISLNWR